MNNADLLHSENNVPRFVKGSTMLRYYPNVRFAQRETVSPASAVTFGGQGYHSGRQPLQTWEYTTDLQRKRTATRSKYLLPKNGAILRQNAPLTTTPLNHKCNTAKTSGKNLHYQNMTKMYDNPGSNKFFIQKRI